MSEPPPRPRTVDEVAASYEDFLVRVPQPALDVCIVCHSVVAGGYPTCYPCQQAS